MPMRVSAINERREHFSLPWGEDEVHITYAAGRFDSMTDAEKEALHKRFTALQAIPGDDAETEAKAVIADLVCTYVRVWDVAGDDDAPFPLDAAQIAAQLSPLFNLAVMWNVFADYAAKKASGIPSFMPIAAGSSAAPEASPSTNSQTNGRRPRSTG